MTETSEITYLKLENEMDLILAHKRSLKLAELCNFSSSVQTYFATGVSEIARVALGRKKEHSGHLMLNVSATRAAKKLVAQITFLASELRHSQEALTYARKLIDEVVVSEPTKGKVTVSLFQKIPLGGLITPEKLSYFAEFFKKETGISPYDELRKKNLQLITLSEKLRESEGDYRKLSETLPLMMFTLNALGKISKSNDWFNSAFEEKKSYTGIGWQTLLMPEDAQRLNGDWEKAQIDKQSFRAQARLRLNSDNVWHLINIVPLKDKRDNITEWAGFFVDIHAQKLVEETLKNNEELRRMQTQLMEKNEELTVQKDFVETILDSTVDLISVLDTEKRFLAFNRQCEDLFGMEREEVLGKHVTEVFVGDAYSTMIDDLETCASGKPVHNPHLFIPSHKTHLEVFLVPLRDFRQNVYGVLLIAHDITESIENQKRLQETNAQLKESNSDLEQFAFIASHDLQEPLRKIRNFSEQLGRNFANRDLSLKYLQKIDSAALRMTTLIRNVLEYSKISKVDAGFEAVDLNSVLSDVLIDHELKIEQSGAHIDAGELPLILGIPTQMHQLFSNLIGNSLKFSEEKPYIRLSSVAIGPEEVSERSLDPSQAYHRLMLEDHGIGFEPEYADQIFTIFQRLNDRSTFEGTGIGLALCRKIVEKHRGRIFAQSEPGVGTTISIILPVAESSKQ